LVNVPKSLANDDDGYTLVEVLVALAILSLSLTVLLGIFSQSLARSHESERAAAARVLGQSLLAHAEADPATRLGHTEGESDDGLAWSLDVAPYRQRDDDKATLHAATITVTVSWEDGAHALALSSMRLVPGAGAQ
jgi:general secretion pathway protein I